MLLTWGCREDSHDLVWTTSAGSDFCRAFDRDAAPPHSLFENLDQCEQWVSRRSCRPGYHCFDGCNTVHCTGSGTLWKTLIGCERVVRVAVAFPVASRKLSRTERSALRERRHELWSLLEPPERKLEIIGSSDANEGYTALAQRELADARARVVMAELVALGLPLHRLEPRAGHNTRGASLLSMSGEPAPTHRRLVSFRLARRWSAQSTFDEPPIFSNVTCSGD